MATPKGVYRMIRFTGKKLRKQDQELLMEVAKFTLDKFVPPSRQRNLNITIRLEDNYTRGWMGECEYMGLDLSYRRKFNIVVRSTRINVNAKDALKRLKDIMKTIIHEVVHVKQYANNEMFDYMNGKTKFLGKVYKNPDTYMDYWDMPWEIAAYGLQETVYEQFAFVKKEEERTGVKAKKSKRKTRL